MQQTDHNHYGHSYYSQILTLASDGIPRTWPSQCQRLVWVICVIVSVPVLLMSSWFEMVFGQNIFRILRSDLLTKTSSGLPTLWITEKDTENIAIEDPDFGVGVDNCGSPKGRNIAKACLALLILVLTSLLQSAVVVTLLPKYIKSSMFCSASPFIRIWLLVVVLFSSPAFFWCWPSVLFYWQ